MDKGVHVNHFVDLQKDSGRERLNVDIHKFLEIEEKYALYNRQINEINYWNYSRVQIWNGEICAQKLKLQEAHPKKKLELAVQMKNAITLIKNVIWRGKINTRADILFLAHERRTKIDGAYRCIYTEPLANIFTNCMVLDRPYEYKHLKPESNLKRYYIDYILIIGRLYYLMHKVLRTKHYKTSLSQVKSQTEQPLKEMIEVYQVPSSMEVLYEIILQKLLMAECEQKLYDKLLQKIRPKLIVEVVYYNMCSMTMNALAKKYGIVTVELQHGTMHKDHAAYQMNWKESMPQLPDKIFLFSDFWKKRLSLPIAEDNLVVTGFPYFEKNKNKYMVNRTQKAGKTILFISQGTIGDKLSRLALEVAHELLPRGYQIIYKLHPAETGVWEKKYAYLKDTDIKVETGEDRDIYECFAESDIQVGVYSTAIYEGLGFGLRTFIYNIGYADTMYELVDEGYAQIVSDSCELIKLLEEKNVKKNNLFWQDNALYTMTKVLQELLS